VGIQFGYYSVQNRLIRLAEGYGDAQTLRKLKFYFKSINSIPIYPSLLPKMYVVYFVHQTYHEQYFFGKYDTEDDAECVIDRMSTGWMWYIKGGKVNKWLDCCDTIFNLGVIELDEKDYPWMKNIVAEREPIEFDTVYDMVETAVSCGEPDQSLWYYITLN